jgi:chromosome segregation ATPase
VDIKTQLTLETETQQRFLAATQDIEAEFRSKEAQLKQRIDKQQNSYDKQIGDLKYHALQLKSDAKEASQKQANALQQTNDSQKDAIQAAINTLQEQLGGIKQQLNAVSADPQLLADKETKHAQLQTILQDKQTAEQQANELEQEKQRGQTSINALLNAKQHRENQRDTLKQTQHLLNQQLKATPDTLLGFLREQQPNWVDDIAKVIQPNLLLREDLEPTLTAPNHSLYGLQLNLTNVSADYTADEQQIRQRINDCHEQLEKLHDLDQKEATELDKLAKIQRDLIKQQQLAVASVTACQNQLNKGKQELESLTRQIEQSKKQRQQAVKQQHSNITEQITQQQQQQQLLAVKTQLATQLNDLQTQLASAQQRIDEDNQQKIDSLQQAIKQLHQQQQQQLDDLAEQRLRSLQERKIDTTTLQALENTIARLKNTQQQAEKATDIVKDYQRWQTNEWVRYPEISAHINRCQTLQQQQNQHYDSAKQNFATEQKSLKDKQSSTNTALQTCSKQLDNINYLLKQLNDYALNHCPETVLESAHTVAFLQNEYHKLTEDYKKQRKELTQLINHLKRVLAQEIGTRPAQYYATQERALMDSTEENEWIIAIQNWYEEDLINYKRWLIAQTHNFGGGIHEYKQALEKFNSGVRKLSTRLAAHIDENILFEKIERIEVHLKSKVDTLDYWQQLEQFSQHYNEWQRLGDLPSSDFAKIIEQVASQLQGKGRVETKLVNLLELEIGIVENGRRKTATQADDLKRISSTGLSYLILCVIFIALVNMIRKQQAITIIWPMDELKDLHDCNIEVLLDLLTKNNIHVLSAFPSADPSLLALFANCYEIQGDRNLITFTIGDEYV